MNALTQTAFIKGSEFPALQKGVLRLYSHRFCPYAERVRILLHNKAIQFETVNINLRDQPEWFVTRNPQGLVPVLEIDDKILCESSIINDYLDEIYPQKRAHPSDPYIKARHCMLMLVCGKVANLLRRLRIPELDKEERDELVMGIRDYLQQYEDNLKDKYFGGDDLGMLDIHTWPHLSRLMFIRDALNIDIFPADTFPKLVQYEIDMKKHPSIQACTLDKEMYRMWSESYLAGKPNYDVGLEN